MQTAPHTVFEALQVASNISCCVLAVLGIAAFIAGWRFFAGVSDEMDEPRERRRV
jgi:hypothetical protein